MLNLKADLRQDTINYVILEATRSLQTPTMAPKPDWEKYDKKPEAQKEEKIVALDDSDIQILKTYVHPNFMSKHHDVHSLL